MEAICQLRLISTNTINICGVYNIDLNSIFILLSQIALLAIIFIQYDMTLGIERRKQQS